MTNEELVAEIQAGNREQLCDLWSQVERFVSMQAGRRARQLNGLCGVTEEDLYQTGFLAMVDAAERYNPDAGMSFIGFLGLRLRSYFAEAAGHSTSRRDALNFSVGLEEPVPGADDLSLADMVEDTSAAADFEDVERKIWLEQLHAALDRALDQIPEEQADTLRRRFYDNKTLSQIGEEVGVGAETVRKRECKGLRSIRSWKVSRELEQFIEMNTPYYTGTGLASFRHHGSQPERLVILREKLRKG